MILLFAVLFPLHADRLFHSPAEQAEFQRILCSRTETANIRNDDPALQLFRNRGPTLLDRKIILGDERANSCDPK